MKSINFPFSTHHFRLNGWKWAVVLLGLFFARATLAASSLYENNSVLNYTCPPDPIPTIDATNFVNNNSIIINFTSSTPSANTEFYEPEDTVNYTNNGVMMINTGFKFDTLSSSSGRHSMAGSFYNPGSISCGSLLDTNIAFFFSYGQFIASATNLVVPGNIDVGPDDFIQLTGQNVDLTRSALTIESSGGGVSGTGDFGLNVEVVTNGNTIYFLDWDPSIYLGPNYAESALFPMQPIILYLPNSTSYYDLASPDTNYNIIRCVFIEDTSGSNVAYNIYFDTAGIGFGSGNVTIEWTGSYQDAASGGFHNNYLYLNDNYDLGASTNVALTGNGYPDNFTFVESPTKLIFQPPASPGFYGFPSGTITNFYAFANVQLISVSTNASETNPSGALTNLPGRIQITAIGTNNQMSLNFAQITGPNYLSIQSTNQFNGSAGAQIISPYADINVGVTNGFLTVSNLMQPIIPNWSGTVQAWSTRWLVLSTTTVGTNTTVTGTNDYRVLIVGSQLTPTTLAYVQDLILHGTNSLVLSDAFSVLRKSSVDAQNLTLTTNGPGNGATSLDGELNLFPGIVWSSAFPNLRNLTNNGAIRIGNWAQFIGSTPLGTVIPGAPGAAATGTLSQMGTINVVKNDTVTIGTNQYTFVTRLVNSRANQVKLDATFDGSLSNLMAAINRGAGAGTAYSTATQTNPLVQAGSFSNHGFTVTALTLGSAGNAIATTTTSSHLFWSYSTLTGGVDAVAGTTNTTSLTVPYGAFVNNSLITDQGSDIYANYFLNSGTISNGVSSFKLQSETTILTNGTIMAGGDISITTDTLLASNVVLQAGRGLILQATNLLTDGGGATNGNIWSVGSTNGTGGNGLALMIKPLAGDLLGTTITNYVPGPNKQVNNTWAGQDRGSSTSGYTNNAAIGRLILDAPGSQSIFNFTGAGASNAMYVDYLELRDQATNRDGNGNFTALNINPNMVIYFASAFMNGQSVVDKMNHKNGDRLRWIPAYVGHFSSIDVVYPDGTTNTMNISLVQSTTLDSDGDGIANAFDPTPLFVSSQLDFTSGGTTNIGGIPNVVISWHSIPSATNTVLYDPSISGPFVLVLTNFVSPSLVPPAGGWPITNTVFDPVTGPSRYYRVRLDLSTTTLFGQ